MYIIRNRKTDEVWNEGLGDYLPNEHAASIYEDWEVSGETLPLDGVWEALK